MKYCPVIELRQYTLYPEERDNLIDLFEREFIDTQESVGIEVIGQFRDLDDPDRFVWLRGFSDMSSREKSLSEFYGGPTWKKHRDEANATMIDSDNVLLLRPTSSSFGCFSEDPSRLPATDEQQERGFMAVVVFYLDGPADAKVVDFVERVLKPKLEDHAVSTFAYLETESSPNNFPALPVREGEQVFVWIIHFQDQIPQQTELQKLLCFDNMPDVALPGFSPFTKQPLDVLRLLPTEHSKMP
jgi:hypothetical protein